MSSSTYIRIIYYIWEQTYQKMEHSKRTETSQFVAVEYDQCVKAYVKRE